MVVAYALTTAILSIVIYLGIENNIDLDHFTQDPATIMDTPFYLGFFSYIGILFWAGAAILCFYTRLVLIKTNTSPEHLKFMLSSGMISTLLLFDDLFLLHEEVFPEFFSLSKSIVYVIYVNIILLYLILFRGEWMESEYLILGLACALIGISQFVEYVPMPLPEDSFLEDAVKLFGVVTWFIYYARYCFQKTEAVFDEASFREN